MICTIIFRVFLKEAFRWEDKEIEFLWEWVNGFVIEHPKDETKVIKVWKMKKHDINIEFNNHNDIYNALENLRKEEWLNIKEIKVPKITYQVWDTFYQMERIYGQTYKTRFYIETYKKELLELGIEEEEFKHLKDNQVEEILKMKKLEELPPPTSTEITDLQSTYEEWWNIFYEKNEKWELKEAKTISSIIWLWTDKNNLQILDRNPWNIMKTPNWSIYLIDFWHSS